MKLPVIAVTCNTLPNDSSAFDAGIGTKDQAWQVLAHDYLTSVWNAGAIPLIIPVDEDKNRAAEMLDMADGLLLSGGNDISPEIYGGKAEKCGRVDTARDLMELSLLNRAIETDKPILGICRGIQLINAALGGTVYQDLPSEGFSPHFLSPCERTQPSHKITVKPDTMLASIIGEGEHGVNSYHHQAVKELSPHASACAESEDGVTEAIEIRALRFVLAVQWHPEMMTDSDEQQAIFRAFVNAASKC